MPDDRTATRTPSPRRAVPLHDADRQVVGDRHREHEAPGLGRQAVELVLCRRAGLAENGNQPVPDPGPADGIEVRLTSDHEPGRHG